MTMNIYDLPLLENIIDSIKPPKLLNENEEEEFIESMLHVVHDYIESNSRVFESPNYKNDIEQVLYNEVYETLKMVTNENIDDYSEEFTHKVLHYYFNVHPRRSFSSNYIIYQQTDYDKNIIQNKLNIIEEKNKLEPEQRTPEWYERRHNLLTASSIWKCLDSESNKNSFIYDNCKPVDTSKYEYVNENSPFHWGTKFEPAAQAVYEYLYNSTIKEYGCIPHSKYLFLGASPDGINIKKDSERFGRMLEIKCPSSRIPNGIPSKAYWIQMQMQMECCNLDECDFFECVFKEYSNKDEFDKDGTFYKTNQNSLKGIILKFYKKNTQIPYYEYMPIGLSESQYQKWRNTMIQDLEDKNIEFYNTIYWYIEHYTCVLVQRNHLWFDSVVGIFEDTWNTIVKERKNGYDHRKRKPNKKITTGKICSNLLMSVTKLGAVDNIQNNNKTNKTTNKKVTLIDSFKNEYNKEKTIVEDTINENEHNTIQEPENNNETVIQNKKYKKNKVNKKDKSSDTKKVIINIDI
jgi:putative phage-type endonuclease